MRGAIIMKSIVKILIAIISLICLGCGGNDNKASENPFQKYANEPIFFEGYQKYFVTEYCKEIDNFNSEYLSLQKDIDKLLSDPNTKAVLLKADKGFFSDKIEYSVTNDESIYKGKLSCLSYIGNLKNNKPDGVGMIFIVNRFNSRETYRAYAGHFEDGKFDGYGIIYRIPNGENHYIQEKGFVTNLKYVNQQVINHSGDLTSQNLSKRSKAEVYNNDLIDKYMNLALKFDNSMSYEGNFKDGLRDGNGILYSYGNFITWIEPGKKEFDQLRNKIQSYLDGKVKDNSRYGKMSQMELQDRLRNLDEYEKIDEASVRCQGRLYVMSGEFDNEPDGKCVVYTQNDTGDKGYKFFECEADENKLTGDGKVWNIKGEVVYEGKAGAIMDIVKQLDLRENLTLKDYKLKDDYLNIKL